MQRASKGNTLHNSKQLSEDAQAHLFQLADAIISNEEQLFKKANELIKRFSVGITIVDDETYDTAVEALHRGITQPDHAQRKFRLDQFGKDCDELSKSIKALSSKKDPFLNEYNELATDRATVSKLNIEQFLSTGKEAIEQGHFVEQQCPFCLTPYDLHRLRDEVEKAHSDNFRN